MISETLNRGGSVVEPTKEATDSYSAHFEANQIDNAEFLNVCPPSYFSNEGASSHKWGLFRQWGGGWHDFMRVLREWREAGTLEGLEISVSETVK